MNKLNDGKHNGQPRWKLYKNTRKGKVSIDGLNLFITFWGIVISAILAYNANKLNSSMLDLAREQKNSAIKIEKFEQLINKIDSIATTVNDQKTISNNSNKMKFISAIFKLGAVIGDSTYAMERIFSTDGVRLYVNEVAPILESQLDNPYLSQDSNMLKKWNRAFLNLIIVGEGQAILLSEDGKLLLEENSKKFFISERNPSPIDKISKTKMSRFFFDAWKCVNEAYLYCGRKLENDINIITKP